MENNIKINHTKISKEKFIEIVENFLDNIIITDFNSSSNVSKILIRDKLNSLRYSKNSNKEMNEIAREIDTILDESFGVHFK